RSVTHPADRRAAASAGEGPGDSCRPGFGPGTGGRDRAAQASAGNAAAQIDAFRASTRRRDRDRVMKPWWLWAGTILNSARARPAAYMAANAINIARETDMSSPAVSIAALFVFLPVFCIAVPLAAWRSIKRGRSSGHTAALLLSPFVYAAFLI